MTPDRDKGSGSRPLLTLHLPPPIPTTSPLILPPPSTLSPPPCVTWPLHESCRHPLHPHPRPSLHPPPSTKSPCVRLAAGSATHLLAATNWSDAAEVVAVSALQSCLSLPRQQGEEGQEGDGEGGDERRELERLWTQTKTNMALSDWPLSADLWRLQSKSAAAARQREECLGFFFFFLLSESSIKTIAGLVSTV